MTAKMVQWQNNDGAMTAIIDGYFVHIGLSGNTFVIRIYWENDVKRADESVAYRKFLKPVAVGRKKTQFVTDAVLWAHQRVAKLVEQRKKGGA